jgi:hypothetical protein
MCSPLKHHDFRQCVTVEYGGRGVLDREEVCFMLSNPEVSVAVNKGFVAKEEGVAIESNKEDMAKMFC